jgi:hypothetical protein
MDTARLPVIPVDCHYPTIDFFDGSANPITESYSVTNLQFLGFLKSHLLTPHAIATDTTPATVQNTASSIVI